MTALRRLSEEELRLFLARIAASLLERPLDLPAEAHRERLAEILRRMGEASLYDLLDIDVASPVLKIHEGFERMGRLVHPDNARRLDLAGREGVLEVLFERVTEAYLTLSDPDRRKLYDREHPIWQLQGTPLVSRPEEAQRLYEKARTFAAGDQVHAAIELLREAVRTTPKAEYLAMLGVLESRNPLWLHHAEDHLRRAIGQGAKDPSLPAALAEIRRRIETGETPASDNGSSDSHEVEFI
jgi:curved DNA-binding protein CbpA